MTLEIEALLTSITELGRLRGNPIMLIEASMENDMVPVLYSCLKNMGHSNKVDVLLITEGGQVNAARRIALLMREHITTLNFLIPYRARSAGTLLCLSGDSIVMGTISELGPLDVHMSSNGTPPDGSPISISTEDIHALNTVAKEWFGLKDDKYNSEIFSLLCQHVFPVSLGSFLRAERLMLQIAQEMLSFQMPYEDKEKILFIADRLAKGYLAHDYSITRSEAKSLGLSVEYAIPQEEDTMVAIWNNSRNLLDSYSNKDKQVYGHIVAKNFYAKREMRFGISRNPIQWVIDQD